MAETDKYHLNSNKAVVCIIFHQAINSDQFQSQSFDDVFHLFSGASMPPIMLHIILLVLLNLMIASTAWFLMPPTE